MPERTPVNPPLQRHKAFRLSETSLRRPVRTQIEEPTALQRMWWGDFDIYEEGLKPLARKLLNGIKSLGHTRSQ